MIDVIETTDSVNALKLIIQLFLLVSAFAGAGFLFGRFVYSRTLAVKDATIQEAHMRCLRYKEMIDTADSLSDLKEKTKQLSDYEFAVRSNDQLIEIYNQLVEEERQRATTKSGNG